MYNTEFGKMGEQLAKKELINKGMKFIASNFTFKKLEVDLVFEDKTSKEIVFVEVKSRTSTDFGQPEDAVDERKQQNLRKAASIFVKLNREFKDHKIRFDIFSVLQSGKEFTLQHSISAF